ncbi:MAG: hypothetical protein HC923_03790 [Myxococcales bacterium]|nr:hypothetical protein [Myxococcales bacterium]
MGFGGLRPLVGPASRAGWARPSRLGSPTATELRRPSRRERGFRGSAFFGSAFFGSAFFESAFFGGAFCRTAFFRAAVFWLADATLVRDGEAPFVRAGLAPEVLVFAFDGAAFVFFAVTGFALVAFVREFFAFRDGALSRAAEGFEPRAGAGVRFVAFVDFDPAAFRGGRFVLMRRSPRESPGRLARARAHDDRRRRAG